MTRFLPVLPLLAVSLAAPVAAQSHPPPPSPTPGAVLTQEEPRAANLAEIRARLSGDFLGAEHKDGRTGQGFLRARVVAGGFLARDYWSIGKGKRIYAGHDVLELQADGRARHWWFGSRGDFAYAEGSWTPARLQLLVLEDGTPVRRYTYAFAEAPPLAFRFLNEHARDQGWRAFMDTEWRRGTLDLPPDFLPDPEACPRSSPFRPYVGILHGADGGHRGRFLFGEWLVCDTPHEHFVMAKGWFGRLRLRLWRADGRSFDLRGRQEGGELVFPRPGTRKAVGGAAPRPLFDFEALPDGYRILDEAGRAREYRR